MRRLLPLLSLLLLDVAAAAEPARPTASITKDLCAGLVLHHPAPDVAYQPGVDVHGRPVAPADLPGSPRIALPDAYSIPIEIDLSDRFDPPLSIDGTVEVGTITLTGDRLFFNGQPLTSEDEAAVARACRDAIR